MLLHLPCLLSLLSSPCLAQSEVGSLDQLVESVALSHVEQPEIAEIQRAAVEGLLLWLERHDGAEHVAVLTRQEHERRMRHAEGDRFGVGIGVLLVPGYGIRILEVFPGTPADRAGLETGDVVVAVDGEAVGNRPVTEVARLLSAYGRPQLLLEIVDHFGQPRSLVLAPEAYHAPPVAVSDGEGYRIVRVHHFGKDAAAQIGAALLELGAERELVLDLRDVKDGQVTETVGAAAPFLGREQVACYRSTAGGRVEPVPAPPAARWMRPVAVLINGGTEGVAELFAAMIQRANPAVTLVGTPTAGIDALPTWVDLGPDHVLQLPGMRLSLADGTSWGRVGVVPDVVVQPVEGSQIVPPPAAPADLQVDAALRVVGGP